MVITPKVTDKLAQNTNTLLKETHYPTNIFGNNLYIHLADEKDIRPWLCINKISTNIKIDDIKKELIQQNIKPEGIHRKINGNYPSTIILFKVENEIKHKDIINTKIHINKTITNIRQYINVNVTRCTRCQQLGHLNRACTYARRCVRCAGYTCQIGACIGGATRRCVNCHGNHASSYKNCIALKQHHKGHFEQLKQKSENNILYNLQQELQTQQKKQ